MERFTEYDIMELERNFEDSEFGSELFEPRFVTKKVHVGTRIKTGEIYTSHSHASVGITAVCAPSDDRDEQCYTADVYIGQAKVGKYDSEGDSLTQYVTANDCYQLSEFFAQLANALDSKDQENAAK